MTTRRKKSFLLTLWVLAAALVLHLAAPVVYQAGIMLARQIQHAKMAAPDRQYETEVMTLPASSFERHFTAQERELEIAGMRYDVISHHRSGDIIVCRVIKDEHEQLLLNGMNHVAENDGAGWKFPIWFPVFFQPPAAFYTKSPVAFSARFGFPVNEWRKAGIADSYVSPPPELSAVIPG